MSWVTEPMPSEMCSCGAKLWTHSKSLDGVERERASFRKAHSGCGTPVVVTDEMVERAAAVAFNNAHATGVDVGTWDECPEPDRSELLADFRLALEEALRT